MKRLKNAHRRLWRALIVSLLVGGGVAVVCAFQSVGRQSFHAGLTTEGFPIGPLKIQHFSLGRVSVVTRQTILIGEAGTEVPPVQPVYSKRLTTASDFGPVENRKIRVQIVYRFIPAFDPNGSNVPFKTTPVIEGSDYTAFSFQIPPADVVTGVFQYRIEAFGLDFVNNQQVVVSKTTLPATTPQDPEPLISINSQANASVTIPPEGGELILPSGNQAGPPSKISFQAGLFAAPTAVTLDELPVTNVPGGLSQVISAYGFSSDVIPRNSAVQGTFAIPAFDYISGPTALVNGTQIPVKNVSVAAWDGFAWRPLGGAVNLTNNTITMRIGFYSIFALVAAPPLSAEDRRPPQRIVTPNGDDVNDFADFAFGDRTDNIRVEIFDIRGHRVRSFYSLTTMRWDGRDDNGQVLESGVYIYQYEIDGKKISGIIAIAK